MRGYTTGTFDLPHDGHFQILRQMRGQCDHLTVGLTTDSLAEEQKRAPVLSYAHRKCILENCSSVDAVVAHAGEGKREAHRRMGFDILFIGSDYAESEEYKNLPPALAVRILPRTEGVCTSDLWRGLQRRCVRETAPIALSLSGPVLRAGDGTVIKPLLVGAGEHDPNPTLASTADRYGVGLPEPRNWKGEEEKGEPRHPFVSGVSPFREAMVSGPLRKYGWYPVLEWVLKYEDPLAPELREEKHPVRRMLAERSRPRAVYWLLQRDVGVPFEKWASGVRKGGAEWEGAIAQVKAIVKDLRAEGVVHGDIHGGNLCVDASGKVSLIDFGWCLWRGFALTGDERALLEERLRGGFDWAHFTRSLGTSFSGAGRER